MTGVRVLVIEDNPINLELMTYLLEAFGHVAGSAADGEEGIRAALDDPPDVVLCDLELPRKSGVEVLEALRCDPRLDRVPIIAVTASAMAGDRERLLAEGFDGYISKPIAPERFVAEVEEYARRKHGRS